mmetsp:Transcript_7918/g.11424  ORF Transcript_7918/g.11424 Transcript_7918/m.11424 type:complete len:440 (-) Transcript_7918:136-1455(-)
MLTTTQVFCQPVCIKPDLTYTPSTNMAALTEKAVQLKENMDLDSTNISKETVKTYEVEIAKILHTMQRGTPSPPPLKKRKISANQADQKLIGQALPRQPILPNHLQLHGHSKSQESMKLENKATQKAPEQPQIISPLQSDRIHRDQQLNSTNRLPSSVMNAQDVFHFGRSANFALQAFTPSALDFPQIRSLERIALALDPRFSKMIHSSLISSGFYNVGNNSFLTIPQNEKEFKMTTVLPEDHRSSCVTPPNQIPLCLPVAPTTSEIQHITPSSPKKSKKSEVPAGKVKLCRMESCNKAAARRTPYCSNHSGPRRCEKDGCNKCAQGRTRFCIAHGGGRRCTVEGCTKGARDRYFCAAHGGGRRCTVAKCSKLAVDTQGLCTAHGGGRRCEVAGCPKSAQSNTNLCVRHGGGRKCSIDGCSKVARGKSGCCMLHSRMSS